MEKNPPLNYDTLGLTQITFLELSFGVDLSDDQR